MVVNVGFGLVATDDIAAAGVHVAKDAGRAAGVDGGRAAFAGLGDWWLRFLFPVRHRVAGEFGEFVEPS